MGSSTEAPRLRRCYRRKPATSSSLRYGLQALASLHNNASTILSARTIFHNTPRRRGVSSSTIAAPVALGYDERSTQANIQPASGQIRREIATQLALPRRNRRFTGALRGCVENGLFVGATSSSRRTGPA